MEPLLFADENAPEWAFISVAKKRKGVKKWSKIYKKKIKKGGVRGTLVP
jgi:uncharacterized protein YxeA